MGEESALPECVICLTEIALEDRVANAACAHVFHKRCIARWLVQQSTCPTCRADASSIVVCASGRPLADGNVRPCIALGACMVCLVVWGGVMLLSFLVEPLPSAVWKEGMGRP